MVSLYPPISPWVSPHIPLALARCHSAVAMALLPGNHCQGTAFISHKGRQQRGPITPTPEPGHGRQDGALGSVAPPVSTSAGIGGARVVPAEPPGWIRAPRTDSKQAERLQRGASSLFCVSPWARKIPGI